MNRNSKSFTYMVSLIALLLLAGYPAVLSQVLLDDGFRTENATNPPNVTAAPTANETSAPIAAPTSNITLAPNVTASPTSNVTNAPTSNVTIAPTPNTTIAPNTTDKPTISPTNITAAPTSANKTTSIPTVSPTIYPTATRSPEPYHHSSIWKIIGRTIAWLILIALSVLLFGAIMSHRYQIFYFLRGVWYMLLGMECTRWILTKLHLSQYLGNPSGDSGSLNTIIFDQGDLTEGLLMRENS